MLTQRGGKSLVKRVGMPVVVVVLGAFLLVGGLLVRKALAAAAATPSMGWAFCIPFSNQPFGGSESVIPDASGNVYVTYLFAGSGDVDPGPGTATIDSHDSTSNGYGAVAKYDSAGNFLWVTPVFPTQTPSSFVGTVTRCNCSAVGPVSGDAYVRVEIHAPVQFTTLAGTTVTVAPPSGGTAPLIVRFDANTGRVVWIQGFTGGLVHAGINILYGIKCDASENVYVQGSVPAGGTTTLIYAYGPGNGGIPVTFNSAGSYLLKLDNQGNAVWGQQWPVSGSGAQFGVNSITPDAAGNVYVTGGLSGTNYDIDASAGTKIVSSAGGSDILIEKLGPDGSLTWNVLNGTTNNESGNSIVVDGSGNVTVTSSGTFSYPAGGKKTLTGDFAQFDSSGNRKWLTSVNLTATGGLTVDADGSLYLFYSNGNSGPIKYSSAGTLLWNDSSLTSGMNVIRLQIGADYGILMGGHNGGTGPINVSPPNTPLYNITGPGAPVIKWKQ